MERFQSQYGGKRRNCSAVPAIAVNGTRQCPVASEQWFWQRYRALPHGGAARTSTRRCSCVDASRSPTHRFRRESTSRWSACRCVHAMHRSRPGDSCLALTLGAAGGCQVGITYNVTVQLSGVDGDLQPSSMSSIVLESRMITEEVAVEEHLLDFDLPPLPLGQYQLTTVVLDTRRLPSDPVALLSK